MHSSLLTTSRIPFAMGRDGLLPPALVFRHPGFLRACHGVRPYGGTFLVFGGGVAVMTFVLYPYVYLLARAAFTEQSVCVLEAGGGNAGVTVTTPGLLALNAPGKLWVGGETAPALTSKLYSAANAAGSLTAAAKTDRAAAAKWLLAQ
mgnify:CR=1 FL=1